MVGWGGGAWRFPISGGLEVSNFRGRGLNIRPIQGFGGVYDFPDFGSSDECHHQMQSLDNQKFLQNPELVGC